MKIWRDGGEIEVSQYYRIVSDGAPEIRDSSGQLIEPAEEPEIELEEFAEDGEGNRIPLTEGEEIDAYQICALDALDVRKWKIRAIILQPKGGA